MTQKRAALLGLALLGAVSSAHADSVPSFAPSYAEAQARVAERTATRLEQTLRGLPDVVDARVHIAQPDASQSALDAPLPAPRVSAWIKLRGPGPSDANLRALLGAAVAGVAPASIPIVRQEATPIAAAEAPTLTFVGPFRVARSSAAGLRAVLALLLGLNVVLCTFIVVRYARPRR